MEIELVKIDQLSGNKAQIYSVIVNEGANSLFDQFLHTYNQEYPKELRNIVSKLRTMGVDTGTQDVFFKLNEGKLGDGVCALYDSPNSNIRVYCIRFGNAAVILGGGGHKPKNIRAYQEDPILKEEAEKTIKISKMVSKAIIDKELQFNENGDFSGNLKIEE